MVSVIRRAPVLVSVLAALVQPGCQFEYSPLPDSGTWELSAAAPNELNRAAGDLSLYEVQVRTANACHPEVGSPTQRAACATKVSPELAYRAEGETCEDIARLQQIRLGTLDDLLEPTTEFREGITLAYVDERVGANTLWLMPLFPNNDRWDLPHRCDNLGSPYAVRDYLHARGSLSRACIRAGRDEEALTPCWGNEALQAVIDAAHARGMRVLLDVALNHFGHNYRLYDLARFTPIRARTAAGEDLRRLWDFEGTFEPGLVAAAALDTPARLQAAAQADPALAEDLGALQRRCATLSGDRLVRAVALWRLAFDWERERFSCAAETLEEALPGFYLGADRRSPSSGLGDNYTNDWRDVKFLFHHEDDEAHRWEFVRTRELMFRILNYWVARGVDGFRLDHATDPDSGLGANEWKYVTSKVDYYAWRRGQARPVFLAEEFHAQQDMNAVADILIEGYVRDMNGRWGRPKTATWVERVVDNTRRFDGRTFVLTALETHDERRLVDGTGFNAWTGAGFWGIGAAQWSTPMLLMGQELGEDRGLAFRRSDFLRSRFAPRPDADALRDYYRQMLLLRADDANRALRSTAYTFLRTRATGDPDERIFAQVRWSWDGSAVFVMHNLWEQRVRQSYYLEPWLVEALDLTPDGSYRLVDLFSGQQQGLCRTGAELAWALDVTLGAYTRAQWLRLEECPPA